MLFQQRWRNLYEGHGIIRRQWVRITPLLDWLKSKAFPGLAQGAEAGARGSSLSAAALQLQPSSSEGSRAASISPADAGYLQLLLTRWPLADLKKSSQAWGDGLLVQVYWGKRISETYSVLTEDKMLASHEANPGFNSSTSRYDPKAYFLNLQNVQYFPKLPIKKSN